MPAPGWKKKTKSPSGVGLTLVNRQKVAHKANKNNGDDRAGKDVMESVLETRDLDEVMEKAELAGRLFAANNPIPQLLIDSEGDQSNSLSPAELEERRQAEEARHSANLRVPRRPKWNSKMTAEELDADERKAFLHWRRELARLEGNENLVMTPFEKNLDIWRQLWRVLERSDLTVMVVDARNPLFYRCLDLESYVNELGHNKKVMLLLNKADLLTTSSRREWAAYFKSQGLPFLFWSAKIAASILEGKAEISSVNPNPNDNVEPSDDIYVLGREELLHRLEKEAEVIAELQEKSSQASLSEHVKGVSLVQTDEGEIRGGEGTTTESREGTTRESRGGSEVPSRRRVVVGFVGYPNVGKSSTINALLGQKKTGVTSTPGKTKHFQTLIISEGLMLCDCPGLVFPSFSSSKSEMVASGVVPIDRLSDHRGPVQVVADTVSRSSLEEVYGISLPKPKLYEDQARPPSAAELLLVLAASRGYFASSGLPDETRAARLILKDYMGGKLPYCYMPPPADPLDVRTLQGLGNTGASKEDTRPRRDEPDEVEEEANARQKAMSSSSKMKNPDQELLQSNRGTNRSSEDGKSFESARNLLRVDYSSENLARVFADLDASGGMV